MEKDLWLYASGFDPNWRRHGVMTMLTIEVMHWALQSNYPSRQLAASRLSKSLSIFQRSAIMRGSIFRSISDS